MSAIFESDDKLPAQAGSDSSGGSLLELRKQLFIVTGDFVGYSALVYQDDHGGVQNFMRARTKFLNALRSNGGRVVSTPGDFVLACFETAMQAVVASIAAQASSYETAGSTFSWRIGIAFGNVYEIDGDVYGHAVNIASRIQALASPGQILLSDDVLSLLPPDCAITTESLGHQQLKKIPTRIHVHCITRRKTSGTSLPDSSVLTSRIRKSIEKPVIAVYPFDQLDDSPSTRFFSSSLDDEIHLILSRLTNSMVVVQGAAAASSLTPHYVLKGSVGNRGRYLRVMPRLFSSEDGQTIWAERYDHDLTGAFDAQDHIAWEVVSALQLALTDGEQAEIWRRGTTSGLAWERFQRGHDEERRYTPLGHARAKEFYKQALSIDPKYLCAIVALAFCYLDEVRLGWTSDRSTALQIAETLYEEAKALESRHADVEVLCGFLRFLNGDRDSAKARVANAAAMASHNPEVTGYCGALLDLMGEFSDAIRVYNHATTLSHHTPPWILSNMALSYLALDRTQDAEILSRTTTSSHPTYARAWVYLAVCLTRRGEPGEARLAAARVLDLDPEFTITGWMQGGPFADVSLVDRFAEDMKSAGLPG